ncbi:aldo/keto reductase [Planctomicrobium sp. SH664]|uniref:aldo/keto reductase n=1 Tax=Planctomicrobium sp. SH664 TaxID=3448125 RepID=UPI003F5C9BF3
MSTSSANQFPLRPLGQTALRVTPVAMGCWPIAGVTSINVTREQSLRTLRAAVDAGINFFDTAYIYGYEGESETLIGEAFASRDAGLVIASKCGLHWDADRQQTRDARPETIFREFAESTRRLKREVIDLYYLHAPDPQVPVAESAGALRELLDAGQIRAAGVSNFQTLEQLNAFHVVCPISVVQSPFNMLQRQIEREQIPWCLEHNVSLVAYWPLMKGFLAGKISRDHVWDERDGRQRYPVFVGEAWDKTHDFLDELRPIAAEAECSIAELVIAWTIQQPGITAALCGAKRPEQIQETARAMGVRLSSIHLERIAAAISRRGEVDTPPIR